MRPDELEKALDYVNEEYLAEAEEARNAVAEKKTKISKFRTRRWATNLAAAAAGLVVLVGIGIGVNNIGSGSKNSGQFASSTTAGGTYDSLEIGAPEAAAPEEAAADGYYYDNSMDSKADAAAAESGAGNSVEASGDYSQKLVRTYYYNYETQDFDASVEKIRTLVEENHGYIESSELSTGYRRYAYMELRIPVSNVDTFLAEAGEIGTITNETSSAEDITLNYYSVKDRLESLRAQRERLLALMEKAESLTDIAALSQQISDVEYEINNYQTRLNIMDNQVDYATVKMQVSEVTYPTVQEADGFFTRIKKGFASSTADAINSLTDFVVGFVCAVPFLILWGIGIAIAGTIAYRIYKKVIKK